LEENQESEEENNPWLSFADLLAGLMLIFAFLTIYYIKELESTNNTKAAIFKILAEELKMAGIDPKVNPENGTVEISSSIVFDTSSSKLKLEGIEYLSKIIPILSKAIFKVKGAEEEIVSIDIVGFSSQRIMNDKFMNEMMTLSVQRSNSVWSYVLANKEIPYHDKLIKKLRISGWGNAQSITEEDLETDRKVVFQLQFVNPISKFPKATEIKEELEKQK
jgi:outer membrane protein OmpA-like peptidoglycan-associated protein